ncbi:MAG: nuclear transport factor 2 family protein [Woeseiaceae bacterium]
MLRKTLFVLCALLGTTFGSHAYGDEPRTHEQTVRQFVTAFNERDTEAMMALVTEDLQWLSIDGEKVAEETGDKDQLRAAMLSYFESCSSCRSRFIHVFSTGSRVAALEEASFDTQSGRRQQRSLSVYEFSGHLIRRVYYFPVEL